MLLRRLQSSEEKRKVQTTPTVDTCTPYMANRSHSASQPLQCEKFTPILIRDIVKFDNPPMHVTPLDTAGLSHISRPIHDTWRIQATPQINRVPETSSLRQGVCQAHLTPSRSDSQPSEHVKVIPTDGRPSWDRELVQPINHVWCTQVTLRGRRQDAANWSYLNR